MTFDSNPEQDRISSITELLETGLKHPVDGKKIQRFAALQADMQQQQSLLARQALAEEISRETYVVELDKAMQKLAASGEHLFGFDDFHKVFGEFRVHNLFDPQKFIAERRAQR